MSFAITYSYNEGKKSIVMRKKWLVALLCSGMVLSAVACGQSGSTSASKTDESTETAAADSNETEDSEQQTASEEEEVTDDNSGAETDTEETDMIAQAIEMELSSKEAENEEKEVSESAASDTEGATVGERIPDKYIMPFSGDTGTVEAITYIGKDYVGSGEGCEKNAFVYLPAGYDESKQYNVIYLMHGIGGSEKEWGLNDKNSKLKKILDNLIGYGDVQPFILVTPNGKALGNEHTNAQDTFYQFGLELRNDLIPYIESHYATYAEYDENGYDLTATRRHRAMAGLSMGGMQTINIGMCECLDLFSWFGAFSAAPTSYPASKIASIIDPIAEYDVDYFYNICGTEDTIAYQSAAAAAKTLDSVSSKLTDGENFTWFERSGGHDFGIWYLGIYNFAQIAFQDEE